MSYKRGTDVPIEATFADKDGNPYEPDAGTARMYCKSATTGAYLTGYTRAGGGVLMQPQGNGVYWADVQFQLTDPVDQYEIEVEGFVGTKRTLDSIKISVRA